METKKPATRQYTSVKMANHELRTKIIPAWEHTNPNLKVVKDVTITLEFVGDENSAQINIPGDLSLDYLEVVVGNRKAEDLRDLIVVVDNPVTAKERDGEHHVDRFTFTVEYYQFKPLNQVKRLKAKKAVKAKGTSLVPVQMGLKEYIEALDKRITESIRVLLAEQDAKVVEKLEEVMVKIEDVKASVEEVKEDVKETKQGLVKLRAMFDKWREAFGTSKETTV